MVMQASNLMATLYPRSVSIQKLTWYFTRNAFCGKRYMSHCETIPVTFNPR